jgi:peptide/nickel transport system substrate-binding protein/oligopeptide transport system substrate-binding protein
MRLGFGKLTLPGAAVLLGTLGLLAAGCGTPANTGPKLAASQVFQYNFPTGGSGDIATMDPDIVGDANSATVIAMTYDGLVTQKADLSVEPWGATSWEISPDGLTYTFHIRPGQSFSNGTPVTSKNYAYSMDRTLNPCLASGVAYYLWELKDGSAFSNEKCVGGAPAAAAGQTTPVISTLIGDSIQTPDNNTLVLTLAQPAAYFLEALTYPCSYALDPSVIGNDITSEKWTDTLTQGTTGQGTSGMFYVSQWDHQAGKLVLKVNPHWWGKKPTLTEVDFTEFKSSDTAYKAYQAGQFDVGFPTPALLAAAKTQPDFHQVGTLTYFGIDFNWKKAPFDNLDARVAFCLAINRDQLNTSILKGADTPHWNIVTKGMPGYNPNVTGPDGVTSTTGDQAKATSHWQAYTATLGGKSAPAVSYLYVTGSTASQQLAEALQAQWQQALGVNVALKGEDFNTYLSDSGSGNYIISRFGWLDDYPDAQDFLTLLFDTKAQYNSQGASVPAADALMEAADANSNQAQRITNYNQAEQMLINQVATCPLYQGNSNYQVRSYVHGFFIEAGAQTPNDAWQSMYIAAH